MDVEENAALRSSADASPGYWWWFLLGFGSNLSR